MTPDPMIAFLLSGAGHAYYALLGVIAVALALLFNGRELWAGVILLLSGGVFVDLWAHGYQH